MFFLGGKGSVCVQCGCAFSVGCLCVCVVVACCMDKKGEPVSSLGGWNCLGCVMGDMSLIVCGEVVCLGQG